MYKILFLILLISIVPNFSLAKIWPSETNIIPNLTNIERQVLEDTYEYDLPETRLERLEMKVFGACQNGTFSERYDLIKNAAKNYKAYSPEYVRRQNVYNQYRRPIFTGSTGSNWRNVLWGNFMNHFAGGPTGLTPTITPAMDPAYMDYFEAERAMSNGGDYFDYRTNRGYRTTRTDRGARTGVSILD